MDLSLPNPRFSIPPAGEVTLHHTLLVGMNHSECNFSLWDSRQNLISGLYSLEFPHTQTFTSLSAILKHSGWQIPEKILFSSWEHRFCLIPQSLFQESHAESLFHTACGSLGKDEILLSSNISKPEAVILFPTSLALKKDIEDTFPKVTYTHLMKGLLKDLSESGESDSEHKMLIHLRTGRFDIVISENGNPLLLNSFPYKSPDDVVYFCLFALETLSLKAEKIPVWISGQVERQSMAYRQLHKYIRHLHSIQRTKNIHFSRELDALPRHFYNSLFQLPFCE